MYELEETIIRDFGYSEDSILVNAENLSSESFSVHFPDVQYSAIFDSSVLKKIESQEFQNNIQKFVQGTNKNLRII